jgi:Nucleotidyl transferase of unknown function (DUF2204)
MAAHADDMPESLPVTSSIPAELPEKQETLAREVLTAFEGEGIPYAVAGAYALLEHTGICRTTKDLDLFLTAETSAKAISFLQRRGFECEVCDPVWLAKVHRENFFVDLITGMSNATISVEDPWIRRARPAFVLGIQTRVLAPEELLVSKLFVMRRERFDGADIAHIVYGTRGKLDWSRILQLTGEHWEMLLWALILFHYVYPAKSNYVPTVVWQELLGKFTKQISELDPQARFRGSLIDDNMFAIDVNDWGLENLLEEYRARRLAKIAPVAERLCG